MSPAAKRAREPREQPPKTARPWQRAEAGRYRSSDERFTLESDGGGRWFVTDAEELDELGLARTTGPFPTLDAAKSAAGEARGRPAAASPLAKRLRDAGGGSRGESREAAARAGTSARRAGREPAGEPEPSRRSRSAGSERPDPQPAPPPRSWLDELEDRDPAGGRRARRIVEALVREGVADADTLVRRDVLGDDPVVARRLLARDLLAAVAALREPSAEDLLEAILSVAASSPRRRGLPGWELVERDGPEGRQRTLRPTLDDLRRAAGERDEPAD